jgi:thiol-disulfide isomerase/thioredoxin
LEKRIKVTSAVLGAGFNGRRFSMKVLKFGAVWCSGCLVMKPRWAEVEKENPWLETEYFDFDSNSDAVEKYQIEDGRLPIFIFLDRNGNELERRSGELSKEEITSLITQYKDK